MEQDDRREAEAFVRDPDFQRGLAWLTRAIVLRWIATGEGCDAVTVSPTLAEGPTLRILLVAAPEDGEGRATFDAAERALYRALALRDPGRRRSVAP